MKKIKQFASRKDWSNFLWQKLIDKLVFARSKNEVGAILGELIGEYEKQLIIKRLTAAILLKEGTTYRAIGDLLWISPSTISVIKKNFRLHSNGYKSRKYFPPSNQRTRSLSALKNTPSLIDDIINVLFYQPSGKSNIKERWRFLSKL